MAALWTRIQSHGAREEGIALVVAVAFTAILGMTATTAIAYSTQNERSASRMEAETYAQAYAEAALARAYATLYSSSDPRDSNAVPQTTVSFEQGTGTFSGSLASGKWTLVGVGRAWNPNGGAPVERIVRGRTSLATGKKGSANNAVWNYIYVDDTSTCMTLQNSVTISIPLYVKGDLCLENSASLSASTYALHVGGSLTLRNSAHVGENGAGKRLHEVHVGQGCRLDNGPLTSPCGPAHRVYSDTPPDANPLNLTKPPVDLPYWYANAKPGPRHGCTVGSFPGGFDDDTVMNKSRGTVDLTPDGAYNCEVWEAGQLVGKIGWTPSTKSLVIHGTLFWDGDIVFKQSTQAFYSGRATLYASGRVIMNNSTQICGVASCNDGWDPLTNLLAFVAGESQLATSFEVRNSTTFQGAVYAVNDYVEENSATIWGPIIARKVALNNSSKNHYVPIGTLLSGMPADYEEVVTLSNEPGSWG